MSHFWTCWGISGNWFKPKTKPTYGKLAFLILKTQCHTGCITFLDSQIEMIIIESTLTTFELSHNFKANWGSILNCLEPKTIPPKANFACPNQLNALHHLNLVSVTKAYVFSKKHGSFY